MNDKTFELVIQILLTAVIGVCWFKGVDVVIDFIGRFNALGADMRLAGSLTLFIGAVGIVVVTVELFSLIKNSFRT